MSAPLPDEVLLRWLWLSLHTIPGGTATETLIDAFGGDIFAIYAADEERFLSVDGITPAAAKMLCQKEAEEAKEILAYCKNENIGILTPDHPRYPQRLKRIHSFPPVLYVKGKLPDIEDNVCIAMVGTRSMTEYGQKAGYRLANELSLCGAVIVSGMAKGVDGIVHRASIDGGGPTVAVLGCGIDRCYPPEHAGLREEILRHGAILTEFRPFTPPVGKNFPLRNRIISGLCQATVVVEGDGKSGALITARTALEQGRSLFAVPGHVGERTGDGPNRLLKEGARIATCARDILTEYELLYPHRLRLPAEGETLPPVKQQTPSAPPAGEDRFAVTAEAHPASTRKKRLNGTETVQDREESAYREPAQPFRLPEKEDAVEPAVVLEGFEKTVWNELDEEIGVTPDTIAHRGYNVNEVLAALTILEIKGVVRSLPGGMYIRR